MALVKCPECGGNVSTAADVCPHCGFPLWKNKENDYENISAEETKPAKQEKPDLSEPKSDEWVNELSGKKSTIIAGWIVSMLFGLLFGAIGLVTSAAAISVIGFMIAFFSLITILSAALGINMITKKVDGYTIAVYSGFFSHVCMSKGKNNKNR